MTAPEQQKVIQQFVQTSLRAIARAEKDERVPSRFTGTGREVWDTFKNELTAADLAVLCIQDAGVAMPIPFDPSLWWPDWPGWAQLHLSTPDAEQWIGEALASAGESRDAYLRRQAAILEIDLPPEDAIAVLPGPQPHERWLELPGTGGWIAYRLCARPDAALYLWENMHVVCSTPQEMLLAGLIAWELNAPPRTALPISLDDADLTSTLKGDAKYHGVVGRRDLHGRRDLRVLQRAGEQPQWI